MTILRPRQAYRLPHAQTFHEKLKTKFTSEPAKKKSAASVHQKAAPTLPGPWQASVATQPDKKARALLNSRKDDTRSRPRPLAEAPTSVPLAVFESHGLSHPQHVTTTVLKKALYACFTASSKLSPLRRQTSRPHRRQYAHHRKALSIFYFSSQRIYQGKARTQSPTTTNYAVEFPTFGEIAGVSTSGVQWISLALGKPPS